MRKRSERLLLAAMAILVLGVATLMVLTSLAEEKRNASRARLQKTEAARLHERLTARPQSAGNQAAQVSDESEPDLAEARDTIAAFDALFEVHDEQFGENAQWSAIVNHIYEPSNPWTQQQWNDLDDFLDKNKVLIARLKLLAKRGGPVTALDLSQGFELELRHLYKIRNYTLLLMADAQARVHHGNVDEAVDDLIAGMQLGDALSSEPVLVSQFVRMTCHTITQRSIRDSFPPGTLSATQTQRLLEHIDTAYGRQAFADSLASEAIFGGDIFDMLRGGDIGTLMDTHMFENHAYSFPQRMKWRLYGSALLRPVLAADETTYLNTLRQMAETVERPFYETRRELEELERRNSSWHRFKPITSRWAPGISRTAMLQAGYEAGLDLTRMGLLLEQHYVQTNAYPESLDAIAPQVGGKLPLDPFTGEAYRYKPSGNTFQLYSVGPDLEDDNGETGLRTPGSSYEGDLTWRGRKPEKEQKATPKPKNIKIAKNSKQ